MAFFFPITDIITIDFVKILSTCFVILAGYLILLLSREDIIWLQKKIAFRNANIIFFYPNSPNNFGRPIFWCISYIFFRHVNRSFLSKEQLIKKTMAFKRKRDIYARQGSCNLATRILESGFKKNGGLHFHEMWNLSKIAEALSKKVSLCAWQVIYIQDWGLWRRIKCFWIYDLWIKFWQWLLVWSEGF